jgi:hypothetical protein
MAPRTASFPRAAAFAVLGTAVYATWLGLHIGGETVVLWFSDLAIVAAALTATILCLGARARHSERMRLFWTLLASGCGAWTIAEVTWTVYDLGFDGEVSVPSLADVGYMAGVALIVAALLVHPAVRERGTRKARFVLDSLVVATALLFLSWVLVLGSLWRSTDLSSLGGFLTLAYPFADIVTVFFIVLVIRRLPAADRIPLACLLGGLLAMSVADSAYAYLAQAQDYGSGGLLDASWLAGYLGIALGAYCADARAAAVTRPERLGLGQLVAPLVPVLLALTVAAVEIRLGNRLEEAAWVMAIVLVGLVLIRQGLLVLDMVHPGRERGYGVITRLEHAVLGHSLPTEAGPAPDASSVRPR